MASTIPVTAQMVGNAFVNQYYHVLHMWPHVVHRFYTDSSRLTRAEVGPEGAVQSAMNQAEIHKMVMSLGYEECRAEIKTVDAQDSFGGSVLVMVSGAMHRNNCRRNFVQSFFLAPQERGYYVLNDIFRYMDEDSQSVAANLKLANGGLEALDRLHIASEADHEGRDCSPPVDFNEEAVATEIPEFTHNSEILEEIANAGMENGLSIQTMEAASTDRAGSFEQLSVPDDFRTTTMEEVFAEKKSYASILRFPKDSYSAGAQPAVDPNSFRHPPGNSEQHASFNQLNHSSHLSTLQAAADVVDESTHLDFQGDVKSVYVRDLPENISSSQLKEDLRRFGCTEPKSISVRSNVKGVWYAFVEFEDSNSARKAIEASPILIGGRTVYIEEKKSTYSGGHGRGHSFQGRGTSQNGLRVRSSYSTGASTKGPGLNGDRDILNRGRGARSTRGGYGGSHNKVPNNNIHDSNSTRF